MRLIGKKKLNDFKQIHADACAQVESWEAEVSEAKWNTPHDLKKRYPKASLPGNQQAIFDICRNQYRLWTEINYQIGIVLVKEIGTHKEYNKWKID